MSNNIWKNIPCSSKQLQLNATLMGGQSFRWTKKAIDNKDKESDITPHEYIGVMGNCVWILRQSTDNLLYQIIGELPYPKTNSKFDIVRMKLPCPTLTKKKSKSNGNNRLLYSDDYYENLLKQYFRLDIDLESYYKIWSLAHQHFAKETQNFYAVRVLNQEPVENLFSFICSQNNHISRITSLVEKLCSKYGSLICTDVNGIEYYTFPNIDELAPKSVEIELRQASFGYRAKFIQKSAEEILHHGGLEWFYRLQQFDYKNAHKELTKLTGIGPKVADCICLMSLNHLQAIPVDTHVYQIAVQNYLPNLKKQKTITSKMYTEIGDHFRITYGPLAGWAQTVLFCADLPKLRKLDEEADGIERKSKKVKT